MLDRFRTSSADDAIQSKSSIRCQRTVIAGTSATDVP